MKKKKELTTEKIFNVTDKTDFANLLQRLFYENDIFAIVEDRFSLYIEKNEDYFISAYSNNKRDIYMLKTPHFQGLIKISGQLVNFQKHVNFLINNKKIKFDEFNPIVLYLVKQISYDEED